MAMVKGAPNNYRKETLTIGGREWRVHQNQNQSLKEKRPRIKANRNKLDLSQQGTLVSKKKFITDFVFWSKRGLG